MRLAVSLVIALAAAGCDSPPAKVAPPEVAPTEVAPTEVAAPTPAAAATFEVRTFAAADVPAGIVTDGQILHGLRFTDANGDNLAVFWAKEQDLFVNHVLLAAGKVARTLREVKQVRGDCEFDYSSAFVPGSIGVTDLDGDDRGEVTFAYKYACRSDMSPQDYKVLVIEDGQKAVLRGTEIMIMQGSEPLGHGKSAPEGFEDQPQLLDHAKAIWKKHVTTSY